MKPFEGVKVLDFTRMIAGPFATHQLGLLGAEIIKIEDKAGDPMRVGIGDSVLKEEGLASTFVLYNSGKRSLTLNLKKPESRAIVHKLVQGADLLVENFRAGVMANLGLGYDVLKKVNPTLVYCSISGFGQSGPESQSPAWDGNAQAMSGMMAITGEEDGPPLRAGYCIADTGTGINAAFAMAAALYQRNATGKGQFIDVAMLDSCISLLSYNAGHWLNGGVEQKRHGNISGTREPTSDVFQAADGAVMLALIQKDHIDLLLDALDLPNFKDDSRFATRAARLENAPFIRGLIQDKIGAISAAQCKGRLDRAGVPCSIVMDLADALVQPQVKHRNLVRELVDSKTGRTMHMVNASFQLEHGSPEPSMPPPRLGQHNQAILSELGYSSDEIQALAEKQVI